MEGRPTFLSTVAAAIMSFPSSTSWRRMQLPNIDTGALDGPHGLAFVGGKVWFTAEGAKAVARYDPTTARVDWIMGTGQNRTHMIYVTADEKQIYTTNVSSATVSILEQVALTPMGPPPGTQAIWSSTMPDRARNLSW